MPTAKEIIKSFSKINVLIIGDVMIDEYIRGSVERISPEAPVPVVHVQEEEQRLGGAANVAKNIAALDAKPFLCTIIGEDAAGDRFLHLMRDNDLSTKGIIAMPERMTTRKTRVLAKNHQILRYDREADGVISAGGEKMLFENIKMIVDEERIDVVVFQDYDKGVITGSLIQQTIDFCHKKSIPVAADPKKLHFFSYTNVDLFKPNIREVNESLQVKLNPKDHAAVQKAAMEIKNRLNAGVLFITLGDQGIFVQNGGESHVVPAHNVRHVADVSGAGDTVISIAALGMAAGLDMDLTAKLANIAGGLVCEEAGVVPVDKNKLIEAAASVL